MPVSAVVHDGAGQPKPSVPIQTGADRLIQLFVATLQPYKAHQAQTQQALDDLQLQSSAKIEQLEMTIQALESELAAFRSETGIPSPVSPIFEAQKEIEVLKELNHRSAQALLKIKTDVGLVSSQSLPDSVQLNAQMVTVLTELATETANLRMTLGLQAEPSVEIPSSFSEPSSLLPMLTDLLLSIQSAQSAWNHTYSTLIQSHSVLEQKAQYLEEQFQASEAVLQKRDEELAMVRGELEAQNQLIFELRATQDRLQTEVVTLQQHRLEDSIPKPEQPSCSPFSEAVVGPDFQLPGQLFQVLGLSLETNTTNTADEIQLLRENEMSLNERIRTLTEEHERANAASQLVIDDLLNQLSQQQKTEVTASQESSTSTLTDLTSAFTDADVDEKSELTASSPSSPTNRTNTASGSHPLSSSDGVGTTSPTRTSPRRVKVPKRSVGGVAPRLSLPVPKSTTHTSKRAASGVHERENSKRAKTTA